MAARTLNKLTDKTVRSLKEPGWYGDGGGLYLRIDAGGAKRWVFVFQWRQKRAEMGLGVYDDVGLAEARESRDAAKKVLKAGKNPIEERKAARAADEAEGPPVFSAWAEELIPSLGLGSEKTVKQWRGMMTAKVGKIAKLRVHEIQTSDVLEALKPYWVSRPETGKKMRERIERILDAARAKGLIVGAWENPARWRGHLQHLLPRRSKPVRHQPAMAYADLPAFMSELRLKEGPAALALQFTILTVARTAETLEGHWSEVDEAGKLWTVPAARMKGSNPREHRVPLTQAALDVLEKIKPPGGALPAAILFPSRYTTKSGFMSENAMSKVLEDMGLKGKATVHGFRSTFRDWAGDTTNFERETIEAALAHVVGDETERAYRRGDALQKRRALMEAWAVFCTSQGNVRALSRPPA